jgi:hypothetical protein
LQVILGNLLKMERYSFLNGYVREGGVVVENERRWTPRLIHLSRSWLVKFHPCVGIRSDIINLHQILSSNLALAAPTDIQIGLPVLPATGSPAHFEILRHWLQLCGDKHLDHHISGDISKQILGDCAFPTRLIDVGRENQPMIRIRDTNGDDFEPDRYIALSHPWGKPPHFCTYPTNLDQLKAGISIDKLPAAFRDAITVTPALGLRYLWIDSMCIIQGPEGDFNKEAKRMEQVLSAAYCVIAASSSSGQSDGFLDKKPPSERAYVSLRQSADKAPFYFCEAVDDFKTYVLDSPLSHRGWVL